LPPWSRDREPPATGAEDSDLYDQALADAVAALRKAEAASIENVQPAAQDADAADDLGVADESFRALLLARIEAAEQAGHIRFADNEDGCGPARTLPVNQLKQQVEKLDATIARLGIGDPRLRLFEQVFEPIARIEAALEDLGVLRITDTGPQSDTGLPTDAPGPDAQRVVEDQIQDLRRHLQELDGLLEAKRSPVFRVARAIGRNVPDVGVKAQTILDAYRALGTAQRVLTPFKDLCGEPSDCWYGNIGFDAKKLAVSGSQVIDLMVVFVMGAAGSLLFITSYLLRNTIQGKTLSFGAGRSVAWFVFRPIFGVVVAFAIYLIYQAGQIALGAGTGTNLAADVNLPILSTVALFAGLLSWQVLELVEQRGQRMFQSAERSHLWAPGLATALRARDVGRADLAAHLDVSESQVQRWIDIVDRVSPEMQDRIAAWLSVLPIEVFSSYRGAGPLIEQKAWGLKSLLDDGGFDRDGVAQAVEVDRKTLDAWADCTQSVPAARQSALVKALRSEYDRVFCHRGSRSAASPAEGGDGKGGEQDDQRHAAPADPSQVNGGASAEGAQSQAPAGGETTPSQ
jgi:hypothetical protein